MNVSSQPLVICSVLERGAERTAARMATVPQGCGLLEIRADHLRAEEVGGLVGQAGRDVIVTVRRPVDGGAFEGSEAERRRILESALDAGARYIDVELDQPLADLAEGDRRDRVILSHHGSPCSLAAMQPIVRRLGASRAARTKLVPAAEQVDEVVAVREVLRDAAHDRRLACFAMGRAGAFSRVVAPAWGSWATYGSVASVAPTAPGQFTATDLLELYDVGRIGADTTFYALIGTQVFRSPSPAMHAAGYRHAGLDARYVPLEVDDPAAFERLLDVEGSPFRGFAVTMPFKRTLFERCVTADPVAASAGAVNTVVIGEAGWTGFNTDGPAAVAAIGRALGGALATTRVAVLGAGGTARAIGAALGGSGALVTYFARDVARAGGASGMRVLDWARAAAAEWDVLVQATPLGSAGESALPAEALTGRVVLDAVYGKHATPLIGAARARGIATIDGYQLLVEQAVLQFERLTGVVPDREVLDSAGRAWLDANA